MANTSIRTPLGRVRGHGSAHSGTGHFIGQRVSAIALAILLPYLIVSAALTLEPGYDSAHAWVSQYIVAVPLLLAIFAGCYHLRLGLQVVIEDYIHRPATKVALLLLNTFAAAALAVGGAFAILMIALGV